MIEYLSKLLFCHRGVRFVDCEAFCQTITKASFYAVFYQFCSGFLGLYLTLYKLIFLGSIDQLHSHQFCCLVVASEICHARISSNSSYSSAKVATIYCMLLATNVSLELVASLLAYFSALTLVL